MIRRFFSPLIALACALTLGACGVPRYDPKSPEGKQAIIDETNSALTAGDCLKAIELIEPLYNSDQTDDEVRLVRASAHGCKANVNFFKFLTDFVSNDLSGTGFWKTLAKLFPSTSVTDGIAESGGYAQDALMAILKPGVIVSTPYRVNEDTQNPGTLVPADRTDESNIYMLIVSMATIGTLQNRYSATDTSNYLKTRVLGYKSTATDGWAKAVNVDIDGCTFAASVMNMLDSFQQIGASSEKLNKISGTITTLTSLMNTACEAGCQGIIPTGCALAAGTCTVCPVSLRNRNSCTGAVSDKNSCAAAGISYLINTDLTAGWPG